MDEPSTTVKKWDMCAHLLSNCGASHKNIVIKTFNACHLQIGRVGTYGQVLYLTSSKLQDKVY